MSILTIKDVRKTFGGLIALDNVNIEVKENTITLIMGPNGSGKTTLINVISGFYKPEKGKILYRNMDITGLPPYEIYRLGIVRTFQIPAPFIKLSVMENMLTAYPNNPGESFLKAPFRKLWINKEAEAIEKAYKILDLLELNHLADHPSCKLSGGQMKLLEIGRALMCGAKLVLADEPASGLNPTLAHKIFSYLTKLKSLNVTFLVVEHRLEVALQYIDYVYAMSRGRVISEGDGEKVLKDPRVLDEYLGG
ncbi:MAG: ABC transporter ATP-binding protein [Candidatus Methanomethylicia archaeon]